MFFRSSRVKVFYRPHFIYLHFLNLILANNFWRNQIEKAYLFMQMQNDTFKAGIEKSFTIFILGLVSFWLICTLTRQINCIKLGIRILDHSSIHFVKVSPIFTWNLNTRHLIVVFEWQNCVLPFEKRTQWSGFWVMPQTQDFNCAVQP